MKLTWCSGILLISGQLAGGGISDLCICAFCSMCNSHGVVVFHRTMVNWGVHLILTFVSSAIIENYVV